jgi:hypothetical protein
MLHMEPNVSARVLDDVIHPLRTLELGFMKFPLMMIICRFGEVVESHSLMMSWFWP